MENHLGRIIRESGLRRDVIQKHMGVSRNTLSNWCTGRSTPTVKDLFKLAHYLGRNVNEFYTYKEEEESK